MPDTAPKLQFHVESRRIDSHGSLSHCKSAEIALDTDMAGNPEAFNPAELLLAALSACMIKRGDGRSVYRLWHLCHGLQPTRFPFRL
ncbi:hypothetical protein [Hydrogenophaga sp. BPS33]|uniref:hypothetical protein n=1 Tax=Hydrogenophaga sp. BPS33 TaxID=2651974 RepID=UPI001F2CC691|nr:hypothetical protein [Hydrogenophaga sp. BPS33]